MLDGAVDPDGNAPGRNVECESECDANRIATLSSATVKVTRRLNRITSTRNALVCTVLLHHALRLRPQIAGGESRRRCQRYSLRKYSNGDSSTPVSRLTTSPTKIVWSPPS